MDEQSRLRECKEYGVYFDDIQRSEATKNLNGFPNDSAERPVLTWENLPFTKRKVCDRIRLTSCCISSKHSKNAVFGSCVRSAVPSAVL